MTGAQYRLNRVIERCGEDVSVDEDSTIGIVTQLHPEAARRYLTDAEIDAAGRPFYAIVLKHDDGTMDDTAIEVNGIPATVIKVVERRLRGDTICKVAIAA